MEAYLEEREILTNEKSELLKRKTNLELTIIDLEKEVVSDKLAWTQMETEMQKLEENISSKQAALNELIPKYDEQRQREEQCQIQLSFKEQRRKELLAKQGRGNQFTSREERDKWINREIRSLHQAINDKEDHMKRLREEMIEGNERLIKLQGNLKEMDQEITVYHENMEKHNKILFDLRQQKENMHNERNKLWREENVMQQSISSIKEELSKKEGMLRSLIGKATLKGIDSVRRVLQAIGEQQNRPDIVSGYHGLLIELFSCEKTFYTAVEVTAGNRLFHHVVDTDKIGTKLLMEMNKHNLPGEATFLPLNKLEVRDIEYPNNSDCIQMIEKLHFDKEKFGVTMKHVFGRTLICRNMETSTQLARTQNLDCITLDGDQVSRRGALTGGYYDTRKSRLELQKGKTELLDQLKEQEAAFGDHKTKINDIEGKINQVLSEIQKTEIKNSKFKDVYEKLKGDMKLMKQEIQNIEKSISFKEKSQTNHESTMTSMKYQKKSLESEMGTDLVSQLSLFDQGEMEDLNATIRDLIDAGKAAFTHRMKFEAEKNKIESNLTNNLMRRKDELINAMNEISWEERNFKLCELNQECEHLTDKIKEITERSTELEKSNDNLAFVQRELASEYENAKSKEKEFQDRINDDAKDLEKMSNKQSLLLKKKEECITKIRELGTLPSDAFDKYRDLTLKQLFKKLEQVNRDLKKYSHVNKKALDQFVSFSDQKEKLINRKEELDRGHESISELMQILEQRKYQAIQLTFKQVSNYFTEVFKKLVPEGNGMLVMKKGEIEENEDSPFYTNSGAEVNKNDVADQGMASGSNVQQHSLPLIEQFTGVGIKVCFSDPKDKNFPGGTEMREMQQLSGGQKSLVALALIFAIQKCDPAPFYLFDEIDQALDTQHRKAVSQMIHELSQDAQFITTTFRPELLEHADKFYGVTFKNKVSHVEAVSQEQAKDFVEDDTSHS
ncbi:unnamed protein product [Gordionus sp. m RMFG-2023]